MRISFAVLALLTYSLICISPAQAAEQRKLPEGDSGIAGKYPGDVGIARDANVILVESFEENSVQKVFGRWERPKSRKLMSLWDDKAPGSAGGKCLLVTHVGGGASAIDLYGRLKKKSGGGYGYDEVYCRMYVKFAQDCAGVHHFGTNIGGNNPSTPWPMVSAGNPTKGNKSFWVGIEPGGKRWVWDYYTYWCDMRGSPPAGKTWGNSFIRDPNLKVTRGQWQCIEMMVKVNDVGDTNGEMACWVDGKLVSHLGKGFPVGTWTFDKFNPGLKGNGVTWQGGKKTIPGGKPFKGFRWRTAKELNINYVWLYLYITNSPPGHKSRVWFDQIVVATKYIGPVATKKAAPKKDRPASLVARAAASDPLAPHADAIAAAERLARSGAIDEAARAYRKIVQSVSEKDKTAGERLAVRVEGLKARKKLLRLVIKGVESQGAKAVYIDLFGRTERAKIVKADEEQGTFRIKGSRMPIAWVQISHRRFSGIAGKYAQTASDHLALAQYLAACGDAQPARAALDSALAAKPTDDETKLARRIGAALR